MSHQAEDSEPVGPKETCPCDDPSEQFQLYSDGHGYCYAGSCPTPFWSPERLRAKGWDVEGNLSAQSQDNRSVGERLKVSEDIQAALEAGEARALTRWNISQATCRHWGYLARVNAKGEAEHLAVYRDEAGQAVDIKVRNTGIMGEDKKFFWMGEGHKQVPLLYGLHLLPAKGKMLCICMGEKDCLTVSQLWANKFPVIGPANGEAHLAKELAAHLERLNHFEKIVFVPHSDPAGFETVEKAARIFPAGKAHIAKLPLNDANDMHMAGRDEELIRLIHGASPFQPDGIVDADDIDDQLLNPTEWGSKWAYPFMTTWTYGKRPGEVTVTGAGTGIGKSDHAAEHIAEDIKPAEDGGNYEATAVFNYEAGPLVTLKVILGKLWSKRFNIPNPEDGSPNLYWSPEDMEAARLYRRERCAKLFINDHKGAINWESVKARLRYLKHRFGIKHAYVDPVAALVASEENDTKALDRLFAEAKSLAEELEITLNFYSHLTRPKDGKPHEEGGRVTLSQFRGSNAITMWCSFVWGLERNQQAEDEEEARTTTLRVLKDRFTGDSTGKTRQLLYNQITGRQEEPVLKLEGQDDPPPLTT